MDTRDGRKAVGLYPAWSNEGSDGSKITTCIIFKYKYISEYI